jgi:hypothetical protein
MLKLAVQNVAVGLCRVKYCAIREQKCQSKLWICNYLVNFTKDSVILQKSPVSLNMTPCIFFISVDASEKLAAYRMMDFCDDRGCGYPATSLPIPVYEFVRRLVQSRRILTLQIPDRDASACLTSVTGQWRHQSTDDVKGLAAALKIRWMDKWCGHVGQVRIFRLSRT